uniref:Putative methionine--tRNA ligase n=1 Tax=Noccaea caerulescens TaxID=107243 RepID=A0A1J3JQK8_NOCCA
MEDGSIPIPKLPILGKRNILITSALPNVVDVPHLGNIVGCVLSADVYARYCRLRGYNAIYICGTDDYGTATETKAREENRTPRQICDRYHAIHKEVYDWFDISFDKFGGTSTQEQSQLCLEIFNKLWVNKRLSDYTIPQLYCGSCRRFLADEHLRVSFSAPGDQCENSRKLLYPTTLKVQGLSNHTPNSRHRRSAY